MALASYIDAPGQNRKCQNFIYNQYLSILFPVSYSRRHVHSLLSPLIAQFPIALFYQRSQFCSVCVRVVLVQGVYVLGDSRSRHSHVEMVRIIDLN